jgi:hypothetical protein
MVGEGAGTEAVHKYMSTISSLVDRIKASYRMKFDKTGDKKDKTV